MRTYANGGKLGTAIRHNLSAVIAMRLTPIRSSKIDRRLSAPPDNRRSISIVLPCSSYKGICFPLKSASVAFSSFNAGMLFSPLSLFILLLSWLNQLNASATPRSKPSYLTPNANSTSPTTSHLKWRSSLVSW